MEILHWERKAQPGSKRQHAGVCSLPSLTPRISSRSAKNHRQSSAGSSPVPPQPGNCTQTCSGETERLLGWWGWQHRVTTALLTETPEKPRLALSRADSINNYLVFSSGGDHDRWLFPLQGLPGRASSQDHLLLFLFPLIFRTFLFLHP